MLDTPDLAARWTATGPDLSSVVGQIEQRERQLEQAATDCYADGLINRAQLLAVNQRLEGEIASLRRQLGAGRSSALVAPLAGIDRHGWEALSIDRRRTTIRELVDQIAVAPHPGGRSTRVFAPERVTITWRA